MCAAVSPKHWWGAAVTWSISCGGFAVPTVTAITKPIADAAALLLQHPGTGDMLVAMAIPTAEGPPDWKAPQAARGLLCAQARPLQLTTAANHLSAGVRVEVWLDVVPMAWRCVMAC